MTMINISRYINSIITKASKKAFPLHSNYVSQTYWNIKGTSDLYSHTAINIYNKFYESFPSSKEVAEEILANIQDDNLKMIGEILISQQLSINIKENNTIVVPNKPVTLDNNKDNKIEKTNFSIDININDKYLEKVSNIILKEGISLNTEYTMKNIIVNFSSPKITQEIHLGHMRSAILGDAICKILNFVKNDVKRVNPIRCNIHVGMLIAHLEDVFPNFLKIKPNIQNLKIFSINAEKKYNNSEAFKKKSQEKILLLKNGDLNCRLAWKFICEISRNEYNKLYEKLNNIKIEQLDENFYNTCYEEFLFLLEKSNRFVIDEDYDSKIINIPGYKLPMKLLKSDGQFTHDTSKLFDIWYNINKFEDNWIIFIEGSDQEFHLKKKFNIYKIIYPNSSTTRFDQMGYGPILDTNGSEFSKIEHGSFKLTNLFDEAIRRADNVLAKINKDSLSKEYIETIAFSAVKYYDLKHYRNSHYKFKYEDMFDTKGNTAIYLLKCYNLIKSIYSNENIKEEDITKIIYSNRNNTIFISNPKERQLLLHLIKFNDVIDDTLDDLSPNKLCDHLYGIAVKFMEFYESCEISEEENMNSRLLIVELTRRFMKLSFDLLGLKLIKCRM